MSKIDLSICRNLIYFDFSTYHPFVETLMQYKHKRNLKYSESALCRYYHIFQPKNLSQVLFETDEITPLIDVDPFTVLWPWSDNAIKICGEKGLPISAGCQYFGPVTKEKGLLELQRLIDLYNAIQKKGYNTKYVIKGHYLKRGRDYRFLVTGGNHRMAVLAALEHKEVKVASRDPDIIFIDDIDNWPQVKNGFFDRHIAEKIFNRFFDSCGKDKSERILMRGL